MNELVGGQRRLTPDRDLEPRYTGKTIFTNRRAMPTIQRIALVGFCVGLIVALSLSFGCSWRRCFVSSNCSTT